MRASGCACARGECRPRGVPGNPDVIPVGLRLRSPGAWVGRVCACDRLRGSCRPVSLPVSPIVGGVSRETLARWARVTVMPRRVHVGSEALRFPTFSYDAVYRFYMNYMGQIKGFYEI